MIKRWIWSNRLNFITIIGNGNPLFGEGNDMHSSTAGSDIISSTGTGNNLYGDARLMDTNSQGGADTLTADGNNNNLYGDANIMTTSTGGADTLTADGGDNTLYGDSLDQFIAITDKPFVQFATCSFSH